MPTPLYVKLETLMRHNIRKWRIHSKWKWRPQFVTAFRKCRLHFSETGDSVNGKWWLHSKTFNSFLGRNKISKMWTLFMDLLTPCFMPLDRVWDWQHLFVPCVPGIVFASPASPSKPTTVILAHGISKMPTPFRRVKWVCLLLVHALRWCLGLTTFIR